MRVLVVDDQPQIRKAVRTLLADDGFEISEAIDGEAAERILSENGADVVLCDVFMPERDGLELLRRLRPRTSGVRIIAMSGGGEFHGTVDLLPLATALGAVGVLHKPFTREELLAAIARATSTNPYLDLCQFSGTWNAGIP